MTARFPDDVVAAVCRHMDEDHRDDALLIVRTLGGVPDADDVRTTGVDGAGLRMVATGIDGSTTTVDVAFAEPVQERAQVRTAVVALHERALRAAGLPPSRH